MSTKTMQSQPLQQLQRGHVGLNVSDLDRSKKFYQDVFGFEVMGESREDGRLFVFLSQGQKLVLTLWQQSAGRFEKQRPGLHHLSFQVDTIEQVQAAERKLRAMNVRFHYEGIVPQADELEKTAVYFEDPDGIRLEIYSPTGVEKGSAPVPGAPSCGFF